MSKYIDADRLEKDGWSMQRIRQSSPTVMVYETKKPTDFPAADVQKVQHGRWIMHIDDLFPNESTMECDQCHEEQPLTCDDNYCPHCGARMEGAEE